MARNVTIQRVAPSPTTDNSTGGSFSTGVFTPNADNAIADVDAIEAILNGGIDVAINTTDVGGVQPGNITLASGIAPGVSGTQTLRLNAENDVIVNAGQSIAQNPGAGALNIVLNADSNASGAGKIAFAGTSGNTISFTTHGGNISLGGRDTTLAGAVGGATTFATGTDATSANSTGVDLQYSTLNSGGGDIAIAGHGFNGGGTGNNRGVLMSFASDVNAAGGNVTINAFGGTGDSDNYGVAIGGGPLNQVRTSGSGTINISGTGGNGTNGSNEGVLVGSAVVSAVNGSINITGTGGTSGGAVPNHGIRFGANTDIVSTGSAAITLTGTGNNGGDGIAANSANGNFGPGGTVSIGQGSTGTYSGNISLNSLGGTGISLGGLGTTNVVTTGTVSANAAGAGIFTLASGSSISGTTSVSLTAANITLAGTVTSSGTVTLTPSTNAATIGVSDASKNFSISDAEIDLITAPGVTIGSATNTGGITVGTDGAVTAGAKNLTLVTGTTIAVNGAVSTTGSVALNAGTSITQTVGGVITAGAGGLAATSTSGNITLDTATNATTLVAFNAAGTASYKTSTGINIGTIGSVVGATASGTLTLVTTGAATVIAQTAKISAATLDISTGSSGGVTLTNAGNLIGTVQSTAGLGTGSHQIVDSAGGLNVGPITSTGDLSLVTTGGALTVLGDINVGIKALALTASGNNIVATAAAITAATLTLETGTTGGVSIQTAAHNVGTIQTTGTGVGSGGLTFVQSRAGGTNVGTVTSGTAVFIKEDTGALTVSGAIATTNSAVTLTATASTLDVNAQITTGTTGQVTLNAFGQTAISVALSNIGSLVTDAAGTTVIGGGSVTTAGSQTYHDAVTLGAATNLTGTAITFDSTVNNGGFGLTATNSGAGLFSGAISGSGGFTQAGSGTTTLAATNTYGGATLINAGTLQVDGSIANSAVTIGNGGTLKGTGTVGAVTANSGAHVAPGDSPETLNTGNFTLNSGATLDIEIAGTSAGTQYDQLIVTGTVTLAGNLATSLLSGFNPATGNTFTIIDNDLADAVSGTFNGLAEGATFTNTAGGTSSYTITYVGGTGNDVVLTAVNDAPTLTTMAAPVDTTNEDVQVAITFAEITAQGNENDVDGTVTAFVVKAVTTGTLLIGTSPGTATAFAVGTNDVIDATHQAYWTGASNANGTLNAFTVVARDDGAPGLESTPAVQVQVSVTAVNDEPTLSATGTNPGYAENNANTPVTVFSGAVASTIEAGQTITSMTLTVAGLADGADERLTLDGTTFQLVDGSTILTSTNNLTLHISIVGSTATINFTGASVSASAFQTLVNTLGYSNADNTPTETSRTVTITQIVDSGSNTAPNDNTTALSLASTVAVTATNDVPVLNGLTDTPAFVENGSSVRLDTNQNATVSDPELNASLSNYNGATLTLQRAGGPNADDAFAATGTLDLVDSNGLGENVSLDGGGTFIGTFVDNVDGSVKFTFNQNATAADINDVIRQIVYSNASDNPPASVTINVSLSDGNGDAGGQAQGGGPAPGVTTVGVVVSITQVDDAPALLNVATGSAYVIGSAGVLLSPALNVADVDSVTPSPLTGIASATVSIASGFFAGDELFVNLATSGGFFVYQQDNGDGTFTPIVTNISVVSNTSGTLILGGQDTTQHYQAVLDAVMYRSLAADPSNGGANPTRAITWQVNDGALNSQTPDTDPINPVNATLLHFDRPPVVDLDASGAGTGFTTTFTENGAPLAIADTDASIADPDNAALDKLTITLTNAKAGDALSIAGSVPSGIESTIDTSVAGQITLRLINSAPLADYQTALAQVRFVNTGDNPDTTDRDITVVASEGDIDSNVAHATVHITAVNDAPVAASETANGKQDTPLNGTLHATDPDSTSLTYSLVTQPTHGTVTVASNGSFTYLTDPTYFGPDSFTFKANDGTADSNVATISLSLAQISPPKVAWLGSPDLGVHATAFKVAGIGDFNGNGTDDVLWHNPNTGQVDEWVLKNGQWSSSISLGSHPGQVAGVGDFNGDGTDDILWRDPGTGAVDLWIMKNGQWSGSVNLGNHGTNWIVGGVGDFNGDGTDDIVWRNTATGQVDEWVMKNGQWSGSVDLGSRSTDFKIAGVGDLDHNGTDDILWHNPTTGAVDEWHMANGQWGGSIGLGARPDLFKQTGFVNPDLVGHFEIAGVADINHDGTADVIWRDTVSGNVDAWAMFNGQWFASSFLGPFSKQFDLAGFGNFNGAGGDDALWHNQTTGQTTAWLLGPG